MAPRNTKNLDSRDFGPEKCGNCVHFHQRLGYALGVCSPKRLPEHTDDGVIIRANHVRGDEHHACCVRRKPVGVWPYLE